MTKAVEHADLLDPDKIKANLRTRRIGRKVLVYKSTSSTNDVAAEYARNMDNDGLAIFAEEQTSGRGRAGKKWLSGRADSILCSILLLDCKVGGELLSLTCAVAVAEAVGKAGPSEARIKWPNDIRIGDKKAAGILLESKKVAGRTAYIVGVGINCHQKKKSFAPELRGTATSIDLESGAVCDRISLTKRLLCSMDHWLEAAEKDSKKVIGRWRRLSILFGHRVTIIFNGRQFTGNCIGIDPEKGLILQLDTGGVRMFDAAHTTIAK
jgi:BirA family biotin operon repressor/biotin-[acetyl-CoA-carboxylase] ligase